MPVVAVLSELRRLYKKSNTWERLEALVHDSARADRIVAIRHQVFIATRIGLSFLVLTTLPVYLAIYGAPALVDALFYTFALGPIAAAIYTSRTGNLSAGHNICIASILLLSASLVMLAGSVSAIGLIWLVLAPIEGAIAASVTSVLVASLGAVSIALFSAVSNAMGFSLGVPAQVSQAVPAIIAVSYTTALAAGAIYVAEFQRRVIGSGQIGFRSLSEAIGDLVLRMDRSGAVTFVSENCDHIFGLPQHEFIGRGMFDRVHVGDRPAFLKSVSDAASGNEVVAVTLRIRAPGIDPKSTDTLFRWIELRVNNTHNYDNEREFSHNEDCGRNMVLAVARDVTQIKRHHEELEAAKCKADRANVWKDRFLANVSHELRTPLNAIIGFSEILATESIAPKDAEKSREYAQIIKDSGEHLLSVVNSILDISKIEAGNFDIVPEEFEIEPLLSNCIDMLRLRAEAGGVDLNIELDPAITELVADKRALKQVVINLLSNAIKFTPEDGSVTIGVRPEGNSALLWVQDSGIGIHESELGRIGDPFFQAVDSYDRPYEGTGLGLSVVRGLVGLHGGAIRVESGPGAGTCVAVKLPLDCRQAKVEMTAPAVIEAIPLPPAKAGPADFSLGTSPAGHSGNAESEEVRKIA